MEVYMDNTTAPIPDYDSSALSGHDTHPSIPDFTASPYFSWLESVIQDIASENPKAISIEVVLEDGTCSTRYYNCTTSDRAMMIAAMNEAQIMDTIADHREEILELLNDVEGDDDDDAPDSSDPLAPLGHDTEV
jgi:hypothetical protein